MVAVVVSAAVALAGLYLLHSPDAGNLGGFAWLFLVSGALGVVLNLAVWTRARRQPGRRR